MATLVLIPPGRFRTLDEGVLMDILCQLDHKSLCYLSMTCRYFNTPAKNRWRLAGAAGVVAGSDCEELSPTEAAAQIRVHELLIVWENFIPRWGYGYKHMLRFAENPARKEIISVRDELRTTALTEFRKDHLTLRLARLFLVLGNVERKLVQSFKVQCVESGFANAQAAASAMRAVEILKKLQERTTSGAATELFRAYVQFGTAMAGLYDHMDYYANSVLRAQLPLSMQQYQREDALAAAQSALDEAQRLSDADGVCVRGSVLEAEAHMSCGQLCYAQDQFVGAKDAYQHAIEVFVRVLGEKHLHTATALHKVGRACEMGDLYADAEQFYRRSLSIREELLGPMYYDTAVVRDDLVDSLRKQGKDAEAERLGTMLLSQDDYGAAGGGRLTYASLGHIVPGDHALDGSRFVFTHDPNWDAEVATCIDERPRGAD